MTEKYIENLNELDNLFVLIGDSYSDNRKILNKKVGIYNLAKDLFSNLKLLVQINQLNCETQPFLTLTRMIVDNYSIFYLLSSHEGKEEQKLRYDLYLLDSLSARVKNINEYFNIKDHVFDERILANAKALETRDLEIIEEIKNKILESESLRLIDEKDIENKNWKFVSNFPGQKKFYNWKELYSIAKIPPYYATVIQNHYSAFVHGLSMTLLYERRNEINIKTTFDFLCIIQILIAKILTNEFPNEIDSNKLSENLKMEMNFFWEFWT